MTGAERLSDFLERLDSAYTLYESGTVEEKRELLAEFTSNWGATGKEVDFTVRPEVLLVANRSKSVYGAPQRNSHRTASASRLDGKAKLACTLDQLLSELIKLLAAKPGIDRGQEV
jgi:hypothetical protein